MTAASHDQHTLRSNRRNARTRDLLFHRLVEQALRADPVSHGQIVAGRQHGDHTILGVTRPKWIPPSQESVTMFTRLRKKHHKQLKDANQIPFAKLFDKHSKEDNNE